MEFSEDIARNRWAIYINGAVVWFTTEQKFYIEIHSFDLKSNLMPNTEVNRRQNSIEFENF